MKACIRFTLAAIVCCFSCFSASAAERYYISDAEKTTAVSLGAGAYEAAKEADSNGIAVTRDGIVIISPNTKGSISLTDGEGTEDITVLPPVENDFEETWEQTEYVRFSGEVSSADGNSYLEPTDEAALLDLSAMNILGGTWRIKFKMLKAEPTASDLISVTGRDGTTAAQITLSKRTAEAMYLSYLDSGKMVRMRDVLVNVGEWQGAEAVMDFDAGELDLYVNGERLLAKTPIAAAEGGFTAISFGTAVDDITVASGRVLDECSLEIGIDGASVANDGVYMLDPRISMEFLGTAHEIDAKYLSLCCEGTGIVPQNGKIFADGAAIEEPVNVTVSCAAIVSGTEYKAEKAIEISSGGSDGKKPDTAAAQKPKLTEDGILVRAIGAEGRELRLIICEELDLGAKSYTAKAWTPETEDEGIVLQQLPTAQSFEIYIIDTESGINLLEQEGI